jgi:arginine-tRNA-protein transferase
MDDLWSCGWRHFGTNFFRSNIGEYEGVICRIIPLRINLSEFRLSKNHRRIQRTNADLTATDSPVHLTEEHYRLFDQHVTRFTSHIPKSLHSFLSHAPADTPCPCRAVEFRLRSKLVAVSFLDIGETAVSSVYAMFLPSESGRSLGLLTILREIEIAQSLGCQSYYHGYCYDIPSPYDYKRRFKGLEAYDWGGHWIPQSRIIA